MWGETKGEARVKEIKYSIAVGDVCKIAAMLNEIRECEHEDCRERKDRNA